MALSAALRVLADDLPSVLAQLPPRQRGQLLQLLTALTSGRSSPDPTDDLIELLDDLSPDHLFWEALGWEDRRSVGTADSIDTVELMHALRAAVEAAAATIAREQDDPVTLALRRIHDRLLSNPSVSAAAVSARGDDPNRTGLLRLPRDDGELRLPAFQFDADGRPLDVVLEINSLLYGDADPWGVTSWWLTRNVWLDDAAPAGLLGRVDDEVLIAVARIITERD